MLKYAKSFVNQKSKNKMANKMSLCIIKYTYTQYVGVDIEKYTRGLFEYVKEACGTLCAASD